MHLSSAHRQGSWASSIDRKSSTRQILRYSRADQDDVIVEPEYFIIHPTTVPGRSLQKDNHFRGLQFILRARLNLRVSDV